MGLAVVASLTVTGRNLQVAFYGSVHDWVSLCVVHPILYM